MSRNLWRWADIHIYKTPSAISQQCVLNIQLPLTWLATMSHPMEDNLAEVQTIHCAEDLNVSEKLKAMLFTKGLAVFNCGMFKLILHILPFI